MTTDRSTLFSSPLSFADFVLRLLFFAVAPFGIVAAAFLFPVRGALVDVALALGLFLAGEAFRKRIARVRLLNWLLEEALAFEAYYRERPPRPFVYYCVYPLLFPYWLLSRPARREFLIFRGYTVGGLLVLIVSLVVQYFTSWAPELGIRAYAPTVLLALVVETLLVLALLMPIATTVVWYHGSFRRRRLVVVLGVGLLSTCLALALIAQRRDPIVSYSTRERVRLRTAARERAAHRTLLRAARAAWWKVITSPRTQGDGKVQGEPLAVARTKLEEFYKHDEAYAFDLWAAPRYSPRLVVLYFEARRHKPPIWVAIGEKGQELRSRSELPPGALRQMRKAADGTDPILPVWSRAIDLPGG